MAAREPAQDRRRLLRLVWARPAAEDRRAIRQYIAAGNAHVAIALVELISANVAYLERHPAFGPSGTVLNTRELVERHNYVLVYDLNEGEIILVLRALHAARQWPSRGE